MILSLAHTQTHTRRKPLARLRAQLKQEALAQYAFVLGHGEGRRGEVGGGAAY